VEKFTDIPCPSLGMQSNIHDCTSRTSAAGTSILAFASVTWQITMFGKGLYHPICSLYDASYLYDGLILR